MDDEPTYRIDRCYASGADRVTIKTGLTLQEAKEHCQDSETSSKTATSDEAKARTAAAGHWFDAFYRE